MKTLKNIVEFVYQLGLELSSSYIEFEYSDKN